MDDVTNVAADRRLYSGGAGSVRGYAYQNIGPRNAAGNIVGGRSSVLFSGELRYRMTDTIGLVAFVDAGSAYASILPQLGGLKVGVGAGLRYLTPVGPIRLDVAVPLQPGERRPVGRRLCRARPGFLTGKTQSRQTWGTSWAFRC